MKTPLMAGRCFLSERAFTLIELLAVMTIILILAGLILSIAGNANYKAAESRAQGEISALSAACERYKTDNGAYPRITAAQSALASGLPSTTDTLDPRTSSDPSSGNPSYAGTSQALYRLLCGSYFFDPNGVLTEAVSTTTPQPTAYYNFTDAQLPNTNSVTSGYIRPETVTALNDPFGFSYGYSTFYQYDEDAIASSELSTGVTPSPAPVPTHGFNPSFDLWSTAGYGSSGKTYPTNITPANYNTLWVKNW